MHIISPFQRAQFSKKLRNFLAAAAANSRNAQRTHGGHQFYLFSGLGKIARNTINKEQPKERVLFCMMTVYCCARNFKKKKKKLQTIKKEQP